MPLLNQAIGESEIYLLACRPPPPGMRLILPDGLPPDDYHFRLSFAAICRSELLRHVAGWLMAWGPRIVEVPT